MRIYTCLGSSRGVLKGIAAEEPQKCVSLTGDDLIYRRTPGITVLLSFSLSPSPPLSLALVDYPTKKLSFPQPARR